MFLGNVMENVINFFFLLKEYFGYLVWSWLRGIFLIINVYFVVSIFFGMNLIMGNYLDK